LHQDQTTDVYAIGIMLYQIITGSLPFQGSIQEVLEMQIRNKMPLSNVKDRKIRSVIKKATEKKQCDRYQSASEFRVALDSISEKRNQSGLTFDMNKFVIIVLIVAGLIMGSLLAFFLL
jgi:serine/threonine-protein kinase